MAVIVVSYSRIDRPIVRGLVSLLRAGLRGIKEAVFWDEDLEPGEPWFEQIAANIGTASQVFVLWCDHSSASAQVAREVSYALDARKRVVPVLLSDAPLPDHLKDIHGIDLRELHTHRPPPPPLSPGWPQTPRTPSPLDATFGNIFQAPKWEPLEHTRQAPQWTEPPPASRAKILRQFNKHIKGSTLR